MLKHSATDSPGNQHCGVPRAAGLSIRPDRSGYVRTAKYIGNGYDESADPRVNLDQSGIPRAIR